MILIKYSKATNYALHSMVHLAVAPNQEAVSVEDLAKQQKLSPTYLSKILTKLVKAGLITATPGAKGGYQLHRSPEECNFLDIIQAIEGQEALLTCTMSVGDQTHDKVCLIEKAIQDAEVKMHEALAQKTIAMILEEMHTRH